MEEKLDKIIQYLEDLTIKIDAIEIEIYEIKNGEDEFSIKSKSDIQKYSLELSKIRLEVSQNNES